jgi:hypothetical protein
MGVDELLERAVSVSKTIWRKRGKDISRREVKRMVATDVQPRTTIKVEDDDADGH